MTEHDDVTTPQLREAPRLCLALDPAPAGACPGSPNNIPSKFLKIPSCIVSEWLSNFNKCKGISEFQDSWKITRTTPILKVHNPSSSPECRPISVLPIFLKLFGKVLYHRGDSYLTDHNLIDKRQYGFSENHSTELAIRPTAIYDELPKNFDNELITCSLFLDLSTAFDCWDHETLFDKRYHYGIRGVSHQLFSTVLRNRMQCTKIGAFKSSHKRISCGLPQGSVIAPLLYLIYINDVTQAPSFILLYLLMILIFICQTPVLMFFRQLSTLNYVKLTTGLEPTNFILNYNKINFMLLNDQKHNPISFKVILNKQSIFPKDDLKYLGVLFDNKPSWKPHVKRVKTQLTRAPGVLSKLKHYTTPPVLKVVYNSLIHPYLNYSILNWGRASNATIQSLIKLQNKVLKLIRPTNKQTSLEESFQHSNILCLLKLYTLSVSKFMHSYSWPD